MTEHAVVIAGGGPTGMTLAAELTLAGVDVAIVERRATRELPGSRAGGLHSRTIEVFDQRGIADRFLAEGQVAQVAGFAGVTFDLSDVPTRHPYGLGLWQNHIERILAGWVDELAVTVYRGREATGFQQDDDAGVVATGSPSPLAWVVLALVVGLTVALFVFFWPVWTGQTIAYDAWHLRMWLPRWV